MSDLELDFDRVTPRMLIEFKERTGVALMSLAGEDGQFDLESLSGELVAGIIWISLRTGARPEATWEDALDTPLVSLMATSEVAAEDPTSAS
jgi:hypothetical protein